ncbi:unnamed protein product [Arabidopsis lyrata]|uniref:Predicted protein n=1 Tax=Arabidopsis lyrata subsp. lyrata TaxID=81972 RepID=D7KPV7_ARALL|nr:predicted protein [Arabidopsis lyrata subsp. lyrata]CAH8254740.1 unnamed protein product [Arabidopsis lyrata]
MDSIEDMAQNTVALLPEQHQEIASASSIEDIDNSIGQGTISLLPEQKPHEQHQELAAANIDASDQQQENLPAPLPLILHGQYGGRILHGCSLFGCNHVVVDGEIYCSDTHKEMANSLASEGKAYVIVDGFFNADREKNFRIVLALLRKVEDSVAGGIPEIEDGEIFQKLPVNWNSINLHFLHGEMERSWLFYHKRNTLKLPTFEVGNYTIRWSRSHHAVYKYGEYDDIKSTVFYMRYDPRKGQKPVEGDPCGLRGWSLSENVHKSTSLFCLTYRIGKDYKAPIFNTSKEGGSGKRKRGYDQPSSSGSKGEAPVATLLPEQQQREQHKEEELAAPFRHGQYGGRTLHGCSLFGCNHVVVYGERCCSEFHDEMAAELASQGKAYVIVDGFFDSGKERNYRIVVALLRKVENNLAGGIPEVHDVEIFQKLPREWNFINLDFLHQELERGWLFFHKKSTPEFRIFKVGDKTIHWSRSNPVVHKYGEYDEIHSTVSQLQYYTQRGGKAVDGDPCGLRDWSLSEHVYKSTSLFCLSYHSSKDDKAGIFTMSKGDDCGKRKRGVDQPSSSGSKGKGKDKTVFKDAPLREKQQELPAASLPLHGCSLFGCNHVVVDGERYCCDTHKEMVSQGNAYVVVDGFFDERERNYRIVVALLRKVEDNVDGGIPEIQDVEIFQKLPSEWNFIDLDFLSQGRERSWLFYQQKSTPEFQRFRVGDKTIQWLRSNHAVHKFGEYDEIHSTVSQLRYQIKRGERAVDGDPCGLTGWSLSEHVYKSTSLFCLSYCSSKDDKARIFNTSKGGKRGSNQQSSSGSKGEGRD